MPTFRHDAEHGDPRRPSPLRVALIGVGGYGGNHLAVIREMEERGAGRLVAVADPFEERMKDVSARMKQARVAWYRDHAAMMEAEKALDLVVVAAPIPLHERMTLDILRGSEARILLEKPAVPTLVQLERLLAADPDRRVRVGFQTLHSPQTKRLRDWIQHGELGQVSEVTLVAGWPRNDEYFTRSGWAGRMTLDGETVYDGPATNALSHLLNNVCYVLGGGDGRLFARVHCIEGWLARARDMESYDTFYSECRIAGVRVRALLTHAVAEHVPYVVKVSGDLATAVLSETEPFLRRSDCGSGETFTDPVQPSIAMYSGLVGSKDGFAALPGSLEDVRGYTEWTEGVRVAGPIRTFPAARCRKTDAGVVAVRGMEQALRSFLDGGLPPDPR